jgi:hypothetical protein
MVVIQGAYDLFCAPREQETECYSGTVVYQVDDFQQTALVIDALVTDWLAFQRLVSEWQTQRGAMSSITEAALCPAYQSIIGIGESVVPFLLLHLQTEGDEPDQWFWALAAITRSDPVRDEDRGDYVKMARAWLDWGKREGYAW